MKQFRFISFLFLITLYSCSQAPDSPGVTSDTAMEQKFDQNKQDIPDENSPIDRKVIKEGDISFETGDVRETRAIISKSISELKGYISADNVSNFNDKTEYRITMRVPAENFDILLDKISQHAKKLDSKNIHATDVTAEYIDAESRIKTKKELETRYKELLQQTKKVEEILIIEKEMGTLRTEIESMEGRLKYLQDKVSYSILTVTFYESSTGNFGFGPKMGSAIKNGWTNLLWFSLGLANLWPFIILGLVSIFLYKRITRSQKKN